MAGVGEQARELLHRRRRVEQRAQAGRERGHHLHSRPQRRAEREPLVRLRHPGSPARAPLPSPRGRLHPPARGWAATHSRSRCSRSTPASASCGSIRSATAGAAPGCSADCTPTACRRPEGGTCSTGAASESRLVDRTRAMPSAAAAPRRRVDGSARPAPDPARPPDRACRSTTCASRRASPILRCGHPSRPDAPWSPHDRPGPEFDHVLDARTPLLARAFEVGASVDDARVAQPAVGAPGAAGAAGRRAGRRRVRPPPRSRSRSARSRAKRISPGAVACATASARSTRPLR